MYLKTLFEWWLNWWSSVVQHAVEIWVILFILVFRCLVEFVTASVLSTDRVSWFPYLVLALIHWLSLHYHVHLISHWSLPCVSRSSIKACIIARGRRSNIFSLTKTLSWVHCVSHLLLIILGHAFSLCWLTIVISPHRHFSFIIAVTIVLVVLLVWLLLWV